LQTFFFLSFSSLHYPFFLMSIFFILKTIYMRNFALINFCAVVAGCVIRITLRM